MRQRKKENGRRKNCKELRGKKLKMQACIMENMKVGNRLCTIPNPHLSTPLPMFFLFDIGSNALEVIS